MRYIRFFLSLALGFGLSFNAFADHNCGTEAHCKGHHHEHGGADARHAEFLKELSQRLTDQLYRQESQALWQDPDLQLMALVGRVLIDTYSPDQNQFDQMIQQKRKSLGRKLVESAKQRWAGRPKSISQSGAAIKDFFVSLGHLASELPAEIVARAYSGFFEFGAVYLAVVVPTYPPWFLASEAAEHAILGAPLGLACTQLQLGYFFVIGSLLAPTSFVCNYGAAVAENKSGLSGRFKGTMQGLKLAFNDYVRYRAFKDTLQTIKIDDVTYKSINESQLIDQLEGPLKSLAKNKILWPLIVALHQGQVSLVVGATEGLDQAEQNHFQKTWIVFGLLRFILDQMSVATKEDREHGHLSFREYLDKLKAQALLSKSLRQAFAQDRASDNGDCSSLLTAARGLGLSL